MLLHSAVECVSSGKQRIFIGELLNIRMSTYLVHSVHGMRVISDEILSDVSSIENNSLNRVKGYLTQGQRIHHYERQDHSRGSGKSQLLKKSEGAYHNRKLLLSVKVQLNPKVLSEEINFINYTKEKFIYSHNYIFAKLKENTLVQ